MPIKRWSEFHRTPKDSVHEVFLDYARQCKASLHGDFYGITDEDLGQIFDEKHAAGLITGVCADKTQSGGKAQKAWLQRRVDAGVPVTIVTSPTGAINHVKYILCDAVLGADANESYAILGSLNFSGSGEKQENFFFAMNDPVIVADLYQQYVEAQQYGAAHCKQLTPNTTQTPPIPADIAAAAIPPEAPEAVDVAVGESAS